MTSTQTPYYKDNNLTIWQGDNLQVLPLLPDNSVDAIVTDPPYGLRFMGKCWDYDVPTVEQWRECLRVLKPGGHLLSFFGTRTYHRGVVRIEDAGFEIRDMISWLYGSGFPKSLNISKAIDAAAGEKGEVVGVKKQTGAKFKLTQELIDNGGFNDPNRLEFEIVAPATEAAKQWEGWGTALKPAHEDVVVARKPYVSIDDFDIMAQEVVKNICQSKSIARIAEKSSLSNLKEFAGESSIVQWIAEGRISTRDALCVLMDTLRSRLTENMNLSIVLSWLSTLDESCRLANTSIIEMRTSLTMDLKILNSLPLANIVESTVRDGISQNGAELNVFTVASIFSAISARLNYIQGRFAQGSVTSSPLTYCPAEGVSPACEPVCVARKTLSEETIAANVLTWGVGGLNIEGCRVGTDDTRAPSYRMTSKGHQGGGFGTGAMDYERNGSIAGSACGRWPANVIHDGSPEVLEAFPDAPGQIARVTGQEPSEKTRAIFNSFDGDREPMEPRQESDKSAARFFYTAKASRSERGDSKHPTIKPLALISYLIKLVCPEGGIVLDPWAGTGTTAEAAEKNGCRSILIERDLQSCRDIEARLRQAVLPMFNGEAA